MPILFLLLFFLFPHVSYAASVSSSVSVSALIGNKVNIYGYCSPNSKVELKTINAHAVTYSNKFGYFQFHRIYLPPIVSEICFFLEDTHNRTAPPTCIPALPPNDFTSNIGPIILPPTLTVNEEDINPNQTVASSGESIPNTPIYIHFFTQSKNITYPKSANAYSLPGLEVITDKTGHFDFNLPTAYASSYKFFASTHHPLLGPSPKSYTLTISLPSLLLVFWQTYQYLFFPLLSFITSLLLFIILLVKKKKNKYYLPALYPKSLIITSCPIKQSL